MKKNNIYKSVIFIFLIINITLLYILLKKNTKELFNNDTECKNKLIFSDYIRCQRIRDPVVNKEININKEYINKSKLLADKLLIKDELKNIADLNIAKVLGVYNNTKEINLDLLPNKFVIKANHWSGDPLVIDKNKIENLEEFKKKISKRFDTILKKKYSNSYEYHYKYIKPKLFIEEFLKISPIEYKLHVIHGKVIWIYVKNFEINKTNIYTKDWNELNIDADYDKEKFKFDKPSNLNSLIKISELLSNKFNIDYVRIDFFIINNKIYFGEFTMTPHGLGWKITPVEFDKLLMKFILSKKIDYDKINKYIV